MHRFPRGNPQLDERLIAAVKKRRPLWDPTTPLHKNVKVLMFLWRQVSRELNMNEITVKKKWKSLRDYFFRQVKDLDKACVWKGHKNSTGNVDNVVTFKYCLWPLYDKLTFLRENNKSQINHKNVKMNAEDRKILQEIKDLEKQDVTEMETVIYHIPADQCSTSHDSLSDDSDIIQTNDIIIEPPSPQTPGFSGLTQPPPLKKIAPKPAPIVLKETEPSLPETTHPLTLCEPPPLRIFKPSSILKENDPIIKATSLPTLCRPPPLMNIKLTPSDTTNKDPIQTEPNESDSIADLQFFKSLLPFMKEFSLMQKLRVRNAIHDLILGELDSIRKNAEEDVSANRESPRTRDRLTFDVDTESSDHETEPLQQCVIKEEIVFEPSEFECDIKTEPECN